MSLAFVGLAEFYSAELEMLARFIGRFWGVLCKYLFAVAGPGRACYRCCHADPTCGFWRGAHTQHILGITRR